MTANASATNPVYSIMADDASLTPAQIIAEYERGIDLLRNSVADMTPEQIRARPVPGRWSSLEVVCHLVDCDQFGADRIKRTIALDRPLHLGVDPTTYNTALNYQEADVDQELQLFELNRRHLAAMLRRLPDTIWSRPSVHSETGLVTVRQLLLHPIRHLEHHMPFLMEKRQALGLK